MFFTFNIMSPSTFVKDYNLEFKLPTGEMANYYALNALSHDSVLTTIKQSARNSLALVYKLNGKSTDDTSRSDALSIVYEPDNGSYRGEQSLNNNKNTEAFNVYDTVKRMTSTEMKEVVKTFASAPTTPVVKKTKSTSKKSKTADDKIDLNLLDRIVEKNLIREVNANRVHASSIDGYQNMEIEKIVEDDFSESLLMPYYLSMTIHGVGSIVPGDTFRVDYLPKTHFDNSYLQTMQVIHDISPAGWFTTLETQFRTKFTNMDSSAPSVPATPVDPGMIRLNPSALLTMDLKTGRYYGKGNYYGTPKTTTDTNFQTKYLIPFMTDLTVKPNTNWGMTSGTIKPGYILTFKTPAGEKSTGKFEETELNKLQGIFLQSAYAEFSGPNLFWDGKKVHKNGHTPSKHQVMRGPTYSDEIDTLRYLANAYPDGPDYAPRGVYGELHTTDGVSRDPQTDKVEQSPFSFMNEMDYVNHLKFYPAGLSEGDSRKMRGRVYPPAVRFIPDTEYQMLLIPTTGRYAVFNTDEFSQDDINRMIRFFTNNDSEQKSHNVPSALKKG